MNGQPRTEVFSRTRSSLLASKEISRIFWITEVHRRVQKSSSLWPILHHMDPLYTSHCGNVLEINVCVSTCKLFGDVENVIFRRVCRIAKGDC